MISVHTVLLCHIKAMPHSPQKCVGYRVALSWVSRQGEIEMSSVGALPVGERARNAKVLQQRLEFYTDSVLLSSDHLG
jgi:hypothetical protein